MTSDPTPDPMSSDYVRRPDARGHLKVLEVLRKWDPIGVFQYPDWPRDEYDSYAVPLIRMLDAGASRREIVKWMKQTAIWTMGMSFNRRHSTQCAQELIEFWREWKNPQQKRAGSSDAGAPLARGRYNSIAPFVLRVR